MRGRMRIATKRNLFSFNTFFLLGLVIVLPIVFQDPYFLNILIVLLIYGIVAMGYDIIAGYVGELSLLQAAMFGLGAYISVLLMIQGIPFWVALLFACIGVGILGDLIGRLTLRLRGPFFVLVSLGFAEILRIIVDNWMDLTRGPIGISSIPRPYGFEKDFSFYVLVAIFLVAIYFVLTIIVNSRSGRAFIAIRENIDLASSIGIKFPKYKRFAFIISAVIAAIAGTLYAPFVSYIYPGLLGFAYLINIQVMFIMGGQGTLVGPVLGAFIYTFVPELLRITDFIRMTLVGLVVLLFVRFIPGGLFPFVEKIFGRISRKIYSPNRYHEFVITKNSMNELWQKEISTENNIILQVENLTRDFGGLRAADSIQFCIKKREIVGLIGPNGAGKSTIFNLITGFVKPTAGSILYLGKEIKGLKPYDIAGKGVARTFQETNVFGGLTVLQNVVTGGFLTNNMGLKEAFFFPKLFGRGEIRYQQNAMSLLDFIGLAEKADQVASELSYGEQKKLGLSIALATRPNLLLLDEPAAGLSIKESQELMELIKVIAEKGPAVLLVDHDMKVIMGICNRIIVLDYGSKIAEGSPKEIANNKDVIRAYLGERASQYATS
jgi:branched-chain amino acid transport system permease protein